MQGEIYMYVDLYRITTNVCVCAIFLEFCKWPLTCKNKVAIVENTTHAPKPT